jgi:hypothetical protein
MASLNRQKKRKQQELEAKAEEEKISFSCCKERRRMNARDLS